MLDIVRIENTLKEIRDSQPNPAAYQMYDPNQIEDSSEYGDFYQERRES